MGKGGMGQEGNRDLEHRSQMTSFFFLREQEGESTSGGGGAKRERERERERACACVR